MPVMDFDMYGNTVTIGKGANHHKKMGKKWF